MNNRFVLLVCLLFANSTFAFPVTLLTCGLNTNATEKVQITVNKDDDPNEFGSIFAVIESSISQFKTELHTNLKFIDDSSHYRPENYGIYGKDFNVTYNAYSNSYWFSGSLFNKPVNQEIICK